MKVVFVSPRIGGGNDISADQAAVMCASKALESTYGKDIFSKEGNGALYVMIPETDPSKILVTILTDLPTEKVAMFEQSVPRELNRAGFNGVSQRLV
jgi:hypothetical protein